MLVGLVVGVGMVGVGPWVLALSCGVLVGALAGGLADHHARTQREQVRAAVGELPVGVRVAAYRATRRGPVPSGAGVVAAAVRIAEYQLSLVPRRNSIYPLVPLWVVVVPGVLAGVAMVPEFSDVFVVLGVMIVLCGVAVVAQVVWAPRRLRERLRLLGVEEGVERAGAGGLGS
ncbi:hypothetical protein GCM10009741_42580 [Kribbella lupini]|uniref:Tight adherence protein B n=1 Tax=Kribbella lupini TaxID=291602 RepID=A0ABN2B7S6_9ACTN